MQAPCEASSTALSLGSSPHPPLHRQEGRIIHAGFPRRASISASRPRRGTHSASVRAGHPYDHSPSISRASRCTTSTVRPPSGGAGPARARRGSLRSRSGDVARAPSSFAAYPARVCAARASVRTLRRSCSGSWWPTAPASTSARTDGTAVVPPSGSAPPSAGRSRTTPLTARSASRPRRRRESRRRRQVDPVQAAADAFVGRRAAKSEGMVLWPFTRRKPR